jgi:hypothetical protein
MDYGHWTTTLDKFYPEDWVGFTYLITGNLPNGKKIFYIGKKFFQSTTHKAVKGKKNKKKVVKESNWKTYSGSSKFLLSLLEAYGEDKFDFEILSLHESRSSLAYHEVFLIVSLNAMREKYPDGTKVFANGLLPTVRFSLKDDSENELKMRKDLNNIREQITIDPQI